MFSKLKEKLKDALSIFSRKTEEVAVERKVETVVEKKVEKAVEKKAEKAVEKEVKTGGERVTEKAPIKKVEEKKQEVKKPAIPEKKKPKVEEEKKERPKVEIAVSPKAAEKKKEIILPRTEPEKKPKEKINGIKITYFVHGTTTDNEQNLCTGWNQGELSELGKKQSVELRNLIRDEQFDVIFCSDLKRAVDSAKLTFSHEPYKIIKDKRLRECNYGAFNGKGERNVKSDVLRKIDEPFPEGESYHEVERRVASFLNEIWKPYYGKHIAIVAHQAPQLALDVLLKGKSWEQAFKEDWRNTKSWQPGWIYWMTREVKARERIVVEKETKTEAKTVQEKKTEMRIEEKEERASPVAEEQPVAEKQEEEPKKSFFGRLKEKFTKKEEPKEILLQKTSKEEIKTAEKPKEREPQAEKIREQRAEEVQKPAEEREKSQEEEIEQKEPEKGFFTKVKEVFTTKTIDGEKFEELFWELEVTLLENNVSVEVIERIKADLKTELVNKPLPRDVQGKIEDTLRATMLDILSLDREDTINRIKSKSAKPFIIAFFGINGSGKTTSIAKLAHLLQKNGLSITLAACDTFRAAAIQQLEEHANRLGVKMIKHNYGADAAAVAFDAVKYAQKNKVDVVLIDTAGRLHSNSNLMAELEKIIRVTKPDMKIFVGESITGNDCIEQARRFNELVEMDGVILTKADVDEKGGAPLSISYVIKKPILYMGVGQRYEDLEEFDAKVMLGRLGL